MSFLHRNVNFGLLMALIVLALSITVLGIYYTANYGSLSSEYTRQLTSLQKVTDDLLLHKSRLNQTVKDLETKQQDETALTQKYNQLKDDNAQLTSDKQMLQEELQSKGEELAQKNAELVGAKAQVVEQMAEISDLKSDVAYYKDKYQDVCDANPGACT